MIDVLSERIRQLTSSRFDPTVAFKVYDMDRDGFISNGELFLVLKMMVGNNLKVSRALDHSFPSARSLMLLLRSLNRTSNCSRLWTRVCSSCFPALRPFLTSFDLQR